MENAHKDSAKLRQTYPLRRFVLFPNREPDSHSDTGTTSIYEGVSEKASISLSSQPLFQTRTTLYAHHTSMIISSLPFSDQVKILWIHAKGRKDASYKVDALIQEDGSQGLEVRDSTLPLVLRQSNPRQHRDEHNRRAQAILQRIHDRRHRRVRDIPAPTIPPQTAQRRPTKLHAANFKRPQYIHLMLAIIVATLSSSGALEYLSDVFMHRQNRKCKI
jgi:hypothetical protein